MKSLIFATLATLAVVSTVLYKGSLKNDDPIPTPVYDSWVHWKQKNNKAYGTDTEEQYRAKVYYSNFKYVAKVNQSQKDYQLELNKFADLTGAEFKQQYLGFAQQPKLRNEKISPLTNIKTPDSVDWSSRSDVVTPVKDQGQCGSCWAFSSTGGIEGAVGTSGGSMQSLSEQQLVDCAGGVYGNHGCNGGLMDNAFNYVQQYGMMSESSYSYLGQNGTCRFRSDNVVSHIKSHTDVPQKSPSHLMQAVSQQPVSIAINANPIQFYSSGVFSDSCGDQLDHGVLLVGYGTDATTGQKFWKVKNSWGGNFGEQGYFRLLRDDVEGSSGKCGLQLSASYPTV